MARNHHHVDRRFLALNLLKQIDTVNLRHPNIQKHESGLFLFNQFEYTSAVGGIHNAIALVGQDFSDRLTNFVLVVDDHDDLLSQPFFHRVS